MLGFVPMSDLLFQLHTRQTNTQKYTPNMMQKHPNPENRIQNDPDTTPNTTPGTLAIRRLAAGCT